MTSTAYAKKAQDYAMHRPPYALEAIETMCETVGLQASWVVADVGCGTGHVARHLLERAAMVWGVEPDDAMREMAVELLGMNPCFAAVPAAAEATTLPSQSVDLITVGQALHWFNPEQAGQEFDRILKADGWLAFIWNRFGPEKEEDYSVFLEDKKCRRFSFRVTMHEEWGQFIGGSRSAAHAPNHGDPGYEEFERAQRSAFDARSTDGIITIEYCTELVLGRMHRRTSGWSRRGSPRG